MTSPLPRKRLSSRDWASAVETYELGFKNQRELAEEFGVSATAIHKGMKKRGAVRGRRVHETLKDLHERLDRRDLERLEAQAQRAMLIGRFIEKLIEADGNGNLADIDLLVRKVRDVVLA